MFIAAQFTIAKYWKQPKCPSDNEWIKKLWYIYTMEFYAAERKKELIPFATVWNFLNKLKMELPFDLTIPLLGLYSRNPETPRQKNVCTPMFIAAQFTIAKYWKQPKCPSANERIQKLWYIYTMEFYAAERKKELIPLQGHGWNWRALC